MPLALPHLASQHGLALSCRVQRNFFALPSQRAWLPPPPSLLQSKLFALMHSGLAFRYSRWQHTALSQAATVALAAAQTAWCDVCAAPDGAPQRGMRRLADFLTNCHALPLPWEAPPGFEQQRGSTAAEGLPAGSACKSSATGGGAAAAGASAASGGSEPGGPAWLIVPDSLDACRLLLTWAQVNRLPMPACACFLGRPARAYGWLGLWS